MVAPSKRRRDEFQAFYTNCNQITGYMTFLLECRVGMSVLEPCAGDGAFLEELTSSTLQLEVTALELNKNSIETLKDKYKLYNHINVIETDFLFDNLNYQFDRIIANPPYGAYLTEEKRKSLKKTYPEIYAKETYGVFLIRALEKLKSGGKLVFIIPDTFLNLHMHEGLRKALIDNYKIESITLFPSNYFPGVNFGYAGLSIIVISQNKAPEDWHFTINYNLKKKDAFNDILEKSGKSYSTCNVTYNELKKNPSYSIYLPTEDWLNSALQSKLPRIDDICDVVTGFYSGNDAAHLRRGKHIARGTKKYSEIDVPSIFYPNRSNEPSLEGLSGIKTWIPIVKGGNKRFYKPSEWFMDWSKEAVHIYKVTNKKKARFQNSQYYFQQGIAVPMVSSKSITAALIDNRLFDQSIVGIFPHKEYSHLLFYLLGFFNSKLCEKLIRTINSSTNNSANYIKKIPIIIPEETVLQKVTSITKALYELSKNSSPEELNLDELDSIFNDIYKEVHYFNSEKIRLQPS